MCKSNLSQIGLVFITTGGNTINYINIKCHPTICKFHFFVSLHCLNKIGRIWAKLDYSVNYRRKSMITDLVYIPDMANSRHYQPH